MTTYRRPEWRFRYILKNLGTADEIRFGLGLRGYDAPPEDTVQGWRNRNSVPGCWVPVLIEMAVEAGLIKDIADLKPKPRESLKDEPLIRNPEGVAG